MSPSSYADNSATFKTRDKQRVQLGKWAEQAKDKYQFGDQLLFYYCLPIKIVLVFIYVAFVGNQTVVSAFLCTRM